MSQYFIQLSDRDGSLAAQVDEIDYDWAKQWLWGYCFSKLRKNYGLEKSYAKRVYRPDGAKGVRQTIFLHKAILVRSLGPPPDQYHTIGDHRDGNSLNCRRYNLRWATPSMNRLNINGAYPTDLLEFVKAHDAHNVSSGYERGSYIPF
jgi:hypothetical protein